MVVKKAGSQLLFGHLISNNSHLIHIMKYFLITVALSLLGCATNKPPMQTDKFPRIEATTLSGKKIVFPDAASGKTALIVIAFRRQAQGVIDSWRLSFEEQFGNDENSIFYEIPMISSGWKMIAQIIDNGMRSGVPKSLHDHVATYYGPLENYYEFFEIRDKRDAYVFLVDKDGYIIYKDQGYATTNKFKALQRAAGLSK